jgi:hypothetical protein
VRELSNDKWFSWYKDKINKLYKGLCLNQLLFYEKHLPIAGIRELFMAEEIRVVYNTKL